MELELNYTNEIILNEDGIECHVLDTSTIDFSRAKLGRKSSETTILKANGGEKIDTLTSEGLVESTYITNPGETIFFNSEKDKYVPRDSNGVAWQFDKIESYGYEITTKPFDFNGNIAIKVKSTKVAKVLHEIISVPTCIKDAWGPSSHQFLFVGATLKQDLDNGKVTGIDKGSFDKTWEILTQKKEKTDEIKIGTIKKARFEINEFNQFIPTIEVSSDEKSYLVQLYGKKPFSGNVLEPLGKMIKKLGKQSLEELEGMEVKFIDDYYIDSLAKPDDTDFFSFQEYYKRKKETESAKEIKEYIDYIVDQCRYNGGKEVFIDTIMTLAKRFYIDGNIDDIILSSYEKFKQSYPGNPNDVGVNKGMHHK